MPGISTFRRLKLFTFKLNALLDITQAINENLSIEDLLKRYEKILRDELNIGKVLIYKFSEKWECILVSGFKDDTYKKIVVEEDLLPYSEITFITASPNVDLQYFDIIIPVIHKDNPIAFVLIGDIDEEMEGVSPTIKHLRFIQILSNIIIVAIENKRLFNESLRQEAIKKELELASRMQTMLIPNKEILPKNDGFFVTAFYHPHFDVGGDYYDCFELSKNEFGFCMADVSGKGVSAALLMSNFQANLRALFTNEISLVSLIEKLNERVITSANGEKFITLFVAKYNCKTKILEYINAGHNPPLLYEVDNKKITLLNSGCVGVGMLDKIPVIKKATWNINQKTKLFTYTDGLIELIDENGVEFGTQVIEKNISNDKSIDENITDIIKKQNILTGSTAIFDDISILGIEFH